MQNDAFLSAIVNHLSGLRRHPGPLFGAIRPPAPVQPGIPPIRVPPVGFVGPGVRAPGTVAPPPGYVPSPGAPGGLYGPGVSPIDQPAVHPGPLGGAFYGGVVHHLLNSLGSY